MGPTTTSRRDRLWLATIGSLLIAAACAGVGEQRSSAPAATSTPAPTVAASKAVTPTPSAASALSTPRTIGKILGDSAMPAYAVELPDGWSAGDSHFMVKDGASVFGVSVWDAVQVPSDPCHWKGHMATPGPTVDDLVRALLAQPTRNATTPTDVTLAGHAGKYLEWSVPEDMVVTGDADFDGCDTWPDNGHRDFVSWLSTGGGERYQQFAGQVDRLWVLDVNGLRLVIDATYPPDATDALLAELMQIVESVQFFLS